MLVDPRPPPRWLDHVVAMVTKLASRDDAIIILLECRASSAYVFYQRLLLSMYMRVQYVAGRAVSITMQSFRWSGEHNAMHMRACI
jgi:hypothetical protein